MWGSPFLHVLTELAPVFFVIVVPVGMKWRLIVIFNFCFHNDWWCWALFMCLVAACIASLVKCLVTSCAFGRGGLFWLLNCKSSCYFLPPKQYGRFCELGLQPLFTKGYQINTTSWPCPSLTNTPQCPPLPRVQTPKLDLQTITDVVPSLPTLIGILSSGKRLSCDLSFASGCLSLIWCLSFLF